MSLPAGRMILSAAALASALVAQQDVIRLRVPGPVDHAGPDVFFSEAVPAPAPGTKVSAFEFVRSEVGSGSIVKGAPYTAEAATETVMTLADGNRIVNRDVTQIARDTEGRTRRDLTVPLMGPMAGAGIDPPRFSFIFDAPANTSYTLDHNTKTVRKSNGRAFNIAISSKVAAAGGGVVALNGVEGERRVSTGVVGTTRMIEKSGDDGKTESLGKRSIEGVMAEGTRTTMVIPAGQIGNDLPIQIVSERWYSPELQMIVLSTHKDPRQGETTYKLTNIRRSEPVRSLFEVPADYKTVESPNRLEYKMMPPKQ